MCLAIPGKLVSVDEAADPLLRRGKVDFGGARRDVSLAFTPQAAPGDYVLVHVGFALNVIDAEEAQRLFRELERLGELAELEGQEPPT
jgi:hydrogenase expression/formation protein HypC